MKIFWLCVAFCVTLANAHQNQDTNKELHRSHPDNKAHHVKNQEKSNHVKSAHGKANHKTQAKTKHLEQKSHSILRKHFFYKDRSQHNANRPCERNDSSEALRIDYNGGYGLMGFHNQTTHQALILDSNSSIIDLLDGETGSSLLEDSISEKDYLLPANSTWIQSTTSFDDYFWNLTSLQPILQLARDSGTEFSGTNRSHSVLVEARRTLSSYGLTNADLQHFSRNLNGSLRWLYRGNGTFDAPNGLRWFVRVNGAIHSWFSNGQAQEVLGSVDPLELRSIFRACSAHGALLNVFTQLGNRTDIPRLIPENNRRPCSLLRLIQGVTKISNEGVDGLLTILLEFTFILLRDGSIESLFEDVVNYIPDSDVDVSTLQAILRQIQAFIQEQDRRYNNTMRNNIGWLEESVTNCLNNNCVLSGVNITEVAVFLTARTPASAGDSLGRIIGRFLSSPADYFQFVNAVSSSIRLSELPRILNGLQKEIPRLIGAVVHDSNPSEVIIGFPRLVTGLRQFYSRFVSSVFSSVRYSDLIGNFSKITSSLYQGFVKFLRQILENSDPRRIIFNSLGIVTNITSNLVRFLPRPWRDLYNNTATLFFGSSDPNDVTTNLYNAFRNVTNNLGHVWTFPLDSLWNFTTSWPPFSGLSPFINLSLNSTLRPITQQINAFFGGDLVSSINRLISTPLGQTLMSIVTQLVAALVRIVNGILSLTSIRQPSTQTGSSSIDWVLGLPESLLETGLSHLQISNKKAHSHAHERHYNVHHEKEKASHLKPHADREKKLHEHRA